MALKITIDDKNFQDLMDRLSKSLDDLGKSTLMEMADALLVLSREEVPHDTGNLQKMGSAYWDGDGSAVAYNTEYAAYMHEGFAKNSKTGKLMVVHNYQKGRKKKYLEDPLKMNISKWTQIAEAELAKLLG